MAVAFTKSSTVFPTKLPSYRAVCVLQRSSIFSSDALWCLGRGLEHKPSKSRESAVCKNTQIRINRMRYHQIWYHSSSVVQQVRDLASLQQLGSLLWLGFEPWSGNFHMSQARQRGPPWLSRLKIQRCQCCDSGCSCGVGLIPALGTSTCYMGKTKKKASPPIIK